MKWHRKLEWLFLLVVLSSFAIFDCRCKGYDVEYDWILCVAAWDTVVHISYHDNRNDGTTNFNLWTCGIYFRVLNCILSFFSCLIANNVQFRPKQLSSRWLPCHLQEWTGSLQPFHTTVIQTSSMSAHSLWSVLTNYPHTSLRFFLSD